MAANRRLVLGVSCSRAYIPWLDQLPPLYLDQHWWVHPTHVVNVPVCDILAMFHLRHLYHILLERGELDEHIWTWGAGHLEKAFALCLSSTM